MASVIMEGSENSFVMIPREILEKYLTSVSHTQLKLLLWLIAGNGRTFDEMFLCRVLDITPAELSETIRFWVNEKVFIKRGERLSLRTGLSKAESAPVYSGEAVSRKIKEDAKFAELVHKISELYAEIIPTEKLQVILSLNEWLGLPPDVIYLIVEYCKQAGIKGIKGIEKIALEFSEKGADTAERAKLLICEKNYRKTAEAMFASVIGAGGRTLSDTEKKNVAVWTYEFGYGEDMIKYAYDLTVDKTGKYSCSYMNTILRSWHTKGYKTVAAAKNEPAPAGKASSPQSKTVKKSTPSYDVKKNLENQWKLQNEDESD